MMQRYVLRENLAQPVIRSLAYKSPGRLPKSGFIMPVQVKALHGESLSHIAHRTEHIRPQVMSTD